MHIYIHIYWEYRSQLSTSPVKPTSAGDAKSPKKKRPTSSTRCNCNCKGKQTYFAERNADRFSFKQMSTIIPSLYQKKIGIHHWADIIKYVPQKIPPLLPQRISGRLADSSRKHVTNHPERLMSKITGSKFRKPKAIYKQQITFFHPHLLLKTPGPSHLRCSSTGRRISGHHADLGKNEATRP